MHPKLIFDATGSVVKNFFKFGNKKTKTIYLYEALAYDTVKKYGFTVTNMLSEKHTNVSIFTWLSEWVNSNVNPPKETVCDMSLALLSVITNCFTQYSSLSSYINVCADLLIKELPLRESHWLPWCFIRVDVAHFIKMTTKWVPLKAVSRRVKEVILRTFGQMIKCQALTDVETLLLSIFIVITNETDGLDKSTGQATPCEEYKQRLIRYTSTGIVNDKLIDELLTIEEIDEEERITFEDHENITDLPVNNPFQKWAVDVYEKSKHFIREGSGINAMYLPTLVSHIIKSMKLLPLWSGVMVPVFGYGEETASGSAAVESSFKKLKTLTFKDISLPTNIEDFLERHILSLWGFSLIRSTFCHKSIDHNEEDSNTTNDHTENPKINVANESISEEDYIIIDKKKYK